MMRTAFGVFLILHALIHASWLSPKPEDPSYPFDLTTSRLLPSLPTAPLRVVGLVLVAVTVIAFLVAGLGVLNMVGLASVWPAAAVVGALASLVLIALFWHPWFVAGPLLDMAILAAVYFRWP